MPEELKPSEKLLGAPARGMRGEIVILAAIYDLLCDVCDLLTPDYEVVPEPAPAPELPEVETPQAAPTSGRKPRKVE